MAELKGNKKRLTLNLSFFAPNDQNNSSSWAKSTTKSPKSFEPNGVVGLRIVASMNELDQTHNPFFFARSSGAAILAVSPRLTPIPVLNDTTSSASTAAKFGGVAGKFGRPNLEEDMELSEGYTCVISHIGNNLIKTCEYSDDVLSTESESTASYSVSSGVVSAASSLSLQSHGDEAMKVIRTADFLNSCDLCKKQLHGLDSFMYRVEKAFCSAECRCKQISMDEHKEKCGPGAMMKPLEYSISPSSYPMQFFGGAPAA